MIDNSNDAESQPADAMVTASELREFVYCERSWWLSREGIAVSAEAQELRETGLAFHEERAIAARKAHAGRALWLGIVLALAALALWAVSLLEKAR